jgi:hypothetical protein
MEPALAWSMVFLTPSRKEHLGSKQERPMNHGRCQHTTFPLEVLPVDHGGKKIAYCLECGRSGPVCKSSTEAVLALRETARLAIQKD